MKILVISAKGDGLWFVWLMRHEGHDVQWYLEDEKYMAFDGLVPDPLKRIPDPATYDLVVFDRDGMGEDADYCRSLTPTIGGSSLADRLEEDRVFGLEVMEQAGIKVPAWEAFDSPEAGIAWINKTHKRCVFKPVGDGDDKSCTYVSKSDKDMISFMDKIFQKAHVKEYVLQEVVAGGTETASGGWFNGEDWVAVDHNIEVKKLMSGDLGPNTGCAGLLMWLPPRPTPLFQQGLGRVKPWLREQGYVGPIDLNTIVTEGTAYGIEWTPRFGYHGTCNMAALLPANVGCAEFLYATATGSPLVVHNPGVFSATVNFGVPPYPFAEGAKKRNVVPVKGIDLKHIERFFLWDVRCNDEGELETTGIFNGIGSPICTGESIAGVFSDVISRIKALDVPDCMWRDDVPRVIEERYRTLERQGWLRPLG